MCYISAARYPGKKVSRPEVSGYSRVRFDLLLPKSLTFVCLGSSQTLYWATPSQRWWRNTSLWGVKVGDRGVAWWAVYHRGRLFLWGGIAVGVWMIFGVGHDMCVFSEIGFWSSLYVFSLGGRLLKPTKPLWAWTDRIIRHPMFYLKPHNTNQWKQSWRKSDKSKWQSVATIPHHGSNRQKHSIGSECVYFEKRTPCKR